MSDHTTSHHVKSAFSKFGRISSVFVQHTRRWQRRSKFGFVRFSFEADAEVALRHMNGSTLNGVNILVSLARDSHGTHSRAHNPVASHGEPASNSLLKPVEAP